MQNPSDPTRPTRRVCAAVAVALCALCTAFSTPSVLAQAVPTVAPVLSAEVTAPKGATFFALDADITAGSVAAERYARHSTDAVTLDARPITLTDTDLAERIELDWLLPDGTRLRLLRDYVLERSDDDYSWVGHTERDFGNAVIVVRGGSLTAQVQVDGRQFKIRPLGDGTFALFEESPTAYPERERGEAPDYVEVPASAKATAATGAARSSSQVNCPTRVLVTYTDEVALAHADPRGEIQLATDFFNVACASALVDHRLEIARIVELADPEGPGPVDPGVYLNALRIDGDGLYDEVHALRDLYDADLVTGVIQNMGQYCGLGYLGPLPASYAFSLSDYGCIAGNLTYAHELGHNYGARHDSYVDGNGTDNHGYVNTVARWRTVMAYNRECTDQGFNCPRQQFWSNPAVNFQGDPTGIVGDSDNQATLDNAYANMAANEPTDAAKVHDLADVVLAQEEANHYGGLTLATNASASLTYESGALGRFEAPDAVTLGEGFWAKAGATFTASLRDCSSGFPAARRAPAARTLALAEVSGTPTLDLRVMPNPVPVGAAFALAYETPATDFLSIELYGADGRHVRTLSYLPGLDAGAYRVEASAGGLVAGRYVVVLRAGEAQRTASLIVVE